MSIVSYQQKIMFSDQEPIVFLRGEKTYGDRAPQAFFAYVKLPYEQLTRLHHDMDAGRLVRLGEYGRVLLQGIGQPSREQMEYMERNFAFDHTDHFADDEESEAETLLKAA
ncbi:MAG: hypothetical protein FJX23_02590 [Alphaproteobacteria bacterium]|nr:hypothetical protein [Alphaproteobacteria bacterium]